MFRFNTPCSSLLWLSTIALTITALLAGFMAAPLAAQEDPTTARGFEADQVYQFGNLDSIGIFNGSLLLTLPLGPSFPLGGGASYRFNLVYNSNLWDFEHSCAQGDPDDHCSTIATPAKGFTAGAGWNLTFGRLLPPVPTSTKRASGSLSAQMVECMASAARSTRAMPRRPIPATPAMAATCA